VKNPTLSIFLTSISIGQIKWQTSIFPDSKSKGYLLPIKKSVRIAAKIFEGQVVDFEIEISD
jgi:hypothetical protein